MIHHIPDNEEIRDREEAALDSAPRERTPRQPRPDYEDFVEEVVTSRGLELRTVRRYWQDYIA